MFCHKCGTEIADGAIFCHKCGTKVVHGESVGEDEAAHDEAPTCENASSVDLVVTIDDLDDEKSEFTTHVDNILVGKQKCKETFVYHISPGKHAICIGAAVIEIDVPQGGTVELDYHLGQNMKPEIVCHQSQWVTKPSKVDHFAFLKHVNVFGKIGLICLAAFSLVVCIFIVSQILSSVVSVLVTALLVCIGFGLWVSWKDLKTDYQNGSFHMPEGMSPQILLESLAQKFNYPYFKGVRYGMDGECVIDGRYASYKVVFHDNGMGSLLAESEDLGISIMLEAKTIRSYLDKFFDPTRQIDPNADLQRLEKLGKLNLTGNILSVVLRIVEVVVVIVVIVALVRPGSFDKLMNIVVPGIEVRHSYLSEYSSDVTIEEAFNNFFSNEKWSTYTSEGYDYVLFSGNCLVADESADVRINFKITGEHFIVDSVEVNGTPIGILMQYGMLQKIYEDY